MAFQVFFSSILATLLFLTFLVVVIDAQDHAVRPQSITSPHGIVYENPMSFPPSAYDFFHPNYGDAGAPATAPPFPASSKARGGAAVAVAAGGAFSVPPGGRGGAHAAAAGVAAVVLGLVFVVLAAVLASYVVIKQRADLKRTNSAVNAAA